MSERASTAAQHKHTARVYVAEARRVRMTGSWHGWHATLLRWAANARQRAAAEQRQREMFA